MMSPGAHGHALTLPKTLVTPDLLGGSGPAFPQADSGGFWQELQSKGPAQTPVGNSLGVRDQELKISE